MPEVKYAGHSKRKISPKELALHGWTPDAKPLWHFGRCYTHKDGWHISHCGHPTAHYPYILRDPDGRMILTGAAWGNPPTFGTAWPTVASAVDFVAAQREVIEEQMRKGKS